LHNCFFLIFFEKSYPRLFLFLFHIQEFCGMAAHHVDGPQFKEGINHKTAANQDDGQSGNFLSLAI